MKLEQDEKPSTVKGDEGMSGHPSSSRRRFLQKSSATVLITSLAAQPVWGQCTVSGAMSGGSATEGEDDPCQLPLVAGPSPNFWVSVAQNESALGSVFPAIESEDIGALKCFIESVKSSNTFTIPATPDSPMEVIYVGEAISSPGTLQSQLATVWLNAYFGFFVGELLPGRDDSVPQEWVEHFFALSLRFGGVVFGVVNADGATTQWTLPPGVAC